MVSLVMGVVVALAAVGLARTATTTFHEQARSSSTEMSLRMASSRLRQDLMRASYMTTGNIILDPKVAQLEPATDAGTARYTELSKLRGIKVDVNMKAIGTPPAILTANGIKPDAIELSGNFTSDDAYSGTIISGNTTPSGDTSCTNAQTIVLETAGDAATYTLGGGSAGAVDPTLLLANAKAAFMPVPKKKFIAQVTDAIGCTHYVPVCDVNVQGVAPKPTLYVAVDASPGGRGVLYSNAPPGEQGGRVARNCGASETGRVTIAPVGRVRWRLAETSSALAPDPALEAQAAKTDLIREVLDFSGTVVVTEIVAEYIVDLKFGVVYDKAGVQTVLELDSDTDGTGEIFKTTAGDDTLTPGNPGPQRVRSVFYRVAARTSMADRQEDLPLDAGSIKARFCTADISGCKNWARVRTITSEVALTNQSGMFY